ncbi:fumarylacetoacetate hydrolase domain-containing protein 2-like [Cylas formicarius]|uniref:fumarylacetoacetate hydrolase domain-containing protein 2-like n=1 Tax=Cylas formicarius TaxID=197179 RepID=UPI0029587D22|nr:fumarylacetoacetate hydrolase domain-containing protein 2-like [Cylas formicarius]XP_060522474.1 fumarylacetoacetate hydrolase domain-containing protein 2-like [Cylas formicarius]XP_060522475.1 fumarylacetoacetate hydrolase domain-containing protein 2-like [Cylas formicarius]
MKLVQFMMNTGKIRLGVLKGDKVIDLNSHANWVPNNLVEFLHEHESAEKLLNEMSSSPENLSYSLSQVHLLPPIKKPDKILGVALNYRDFCEQNNLAPPKEPIVFSKFASTIIGPYDRIRHPKSSKAVDWEVELVAVIGKVARDVKAEDAFEYIFGYTATQDLTAKDWMQRNGGQFLLCKNMDHFCPLGPYVVTKDEIPDPHNLNLKTWVNGELMQNGNTSDLIFKIDHLVEHLSGVMTLLPGDIICTGTPAGVGSTKKPPTFLKPGDVLESEVQYVGRLKNLVVN